MKSGFPHLVAIISCSKEQDISDFNFSEICESILL